MRNVRMLIRRNPWRLGRSGRRLVGILVRKGAWGFILLGMETLPLSEVKAHLSELIDRVAKTQDRVLVTRNGRPGAVLISPDDLESLEETIVVLSDPELMASVREAKTDSQDSDESITLAEIEEAFARGGKQAVTGLGRVELGHHRAEPR
jgi:antitoxin YefM